jgi:YD repeat-containing protein
MIRLSAPLLAFCVVSLFALPAAQLDAEWFVSDRFGVVRGPLAEHETGDHEYTAFVERTGATEIQTLYHNGQSVRRSMLEYATTAGGETRLVTRTLEVDGELVATEHFHYWADGTLRSVRWVGERGSAVEYRYLDGRLRQEWVASPDGLERTRYDEAGRIVERTRWIDERVVSRETREYWNEEPDGAVRRIIVVADGTERVSRYDESGRLLGTSTARDGTTESDRVRVFEGGLLVEEREVAGDFVRVWRYEYEGETVVRERYSEDGTIVRLTEYTDPEYARVETLYRDGLVVLRVYYREQERVMEEVIRDGEVIRTREFRPRVEESP